MLAFFAALLAAAPSPAPPAQAAPPEAPAATNSTTASADILEAATPWWEKITVTVDDKGKQQACRYETSASPGKACDKAMADSIGEGEKGTAGLFKKVTFERRFSPGAATLDAGKLQPGDILLGRQVMYVTIDADGSITSCHVVEKSGDSTPNYDCDDAKKEQFRAEAGAASAARPAFLTVLAYGHTEQIA